MSTSAPPSGASEAPKKSLAVPLIAGSAALVLIAAVVMQVLRADNVDAQTKETAQANSTSRFSGKSLAQVNGQAITFDVVAEECVKLHGKEVLELLINRMIIAQECQKLGISVTESEILNEVKEIAGKFNLDPSNWYAMLEREQGMTREHYHREVIWPKLALEKLAGEDVTITEAHMKTAFERDYGPRVRARMILVNGNVRQATEIWEKCQANPENFGRLAREHSADSGSRALDGVIPPIRMHGAAGIANRDHGDAANGAWQNVEDQAFKLNDGEVSGVIHVDKGQYVILMREALTTPVVTDINDVWEDLYAALKEEKVQESMALKFESLRENAEVLNYLTGEKSTSSPIQKASAVAGEGRVSTAN